MKIEIDINQNGMSIGEFIYEVIKKNIINMNIKPGSRISEKEISDLLDVSRTPVREAFIKLSKEGLLYVLPQRGTYISYIDLKKVEEIRFIRESIEISIIKIATKDFPEKLLKKLEENINLQKEYIIDKNYKQFMELDEEFHKTIFKGCNKENIWNFIQQINTQYQRLRLLSYIADVNWDKVLEQHIDIFKAIKAQDKIIGEKSVEKHLNKLIVDQKEIIAIYPEYFEENN